MYACIVIIIIIIIVIIIIINAYIVCKLLITKLSYKMSIHKIKSRE